MSSIIPNGKTEWLAISKESRFNIGFEVPDRQGKAIKLSLDVFYTGKGYQMSIYKLDPFESKSVSFKMSTQTPNVRLYAYLGVFEEWMEKEKITVNLASIIATKTLNERACNRNFMELSIDSRMSGKVQVTCFSSDGVLSKV